LKNSSSTLDHRRESFVFKAKTSGPDFDLQTLKMSAPDQIHMFKITAGTHILFLPVEPQLEKGIFQCKTQKISALLCKKHFKIIILVVREELSLWNR